MMSSSGGFQFPDWVVLRQVLEKMRSVAIDKIATNFTDPFDSLMALELGAFAGINRDDKHLALPIYDKIATTLDDKDLVERRVIRPRHELARRLAAERNDELLKPGQKAPKFTLPDLTGTELALDDVLQRNELVYVDFWASWCGPCIEDVPALKDLYTTYKDKGLEILTISIDDDHEDWKETATGLQLPWIDLGSIGGVLTKTPVAYGILGIPAGFLVDTKGCILQKDIRPAELEKALESSLDLSTTNE